jgi:hypothetical protein
MTDWTTSPADRAEAERITDEYFSTRLPSYDTPDRRRNALKWFAESVAEKRRHAEHLARFDRKERAA